jgi:hypothetical protein
MALLISDCLRRERRICLEYNGERKMALDVAKYLENLVYLASKREKFAEAKGPEEKVAGATTLGRGI